MLLHVAMEAGEDEGDGFLTERLDQLRQRAYPGRIDVVERLSVEHQPAYGRRRAGDGLANAPLDVVGVGEEQAIIEPIDQHSGNDRGRRVEPYVGVAVQSFHPPKYGIMRSGAATNSVHK